MILIVSSTEINFVKSKLDLIIYVIKYNSVYDEIQIITSVLRPKR